jgi:hypothetical protein
LRSQHGQRTEFQLCNIIDKIPVVKPAELWVIPTSSFLYLKIEHESLQCSYGILSWPLALGLVVLDSLFSIIPHFSAIAGAMVDGNYALCSKCILKIGIVWISGDGFFETYSNF